LNASVSDACSSFDKLREVANKSNELIADTISQDNIAKPIDEFINSISAITKVTKEFSIAGKESIEGFKEISSSLGTMKSSIESADTSIRSMQSSTLELSNSTKGLLESNSGIKSSNQTLSTDIASFSSTVKSGTQNAGEFFASLKVVGEQITQTGKEFSALKDRAELGVAGVALFSERLGGLANSLSQLGNQLTSLESLLVKNNSDLKLSNQTNRTFISDIENFQNVIKKITTDLGALESRLSRINNAN
jgi:chromosome segregation ATPase